MNEQDELKKAVARAFDLESGKVVLVDFGGTLVRSDYECKDKGTDVCEACKIRFACYLNQYLILEAGKLDLQIDRTINEIVEDYIESAKPRRETTDSQMPAQN